MIHKLYFLKMSLFIMLPLLLNACGNDQSSTQGNDTATAGESVTVNKSQPAAPGPQAAEAEPAPEETNTTTVTAEGNDQEPASEQAGGTNATATDTENTPEYQVECDTDGRNCRVDTETYIGWRIYRSQCAQCHGQEAKGTTIAPSLLARLDQRVDYPRFVDVVTNGYRGQMGVMPAWKDNKGVMKNIPGLYRYLKARADGILDSGRPQQLE